MKKKTKTNNKNKKFWDGRFLDGPAKIMTKINASIHFDKELYRQDISASKVHAAMLSEQKIITVSEKKKIISALDKIEIEIKKNKMQFNDELEDIHTHIESRLIEIIGSTGKKLHTARSRNDQVATDVKLWIKEKNNSLGELLKTLQKTLLAKAENHVLDIMPGFTHIFSPSLASLCKYVW